MKTTTLFQIVLASALLAAAPSASAQIKARGSDSTLHVVKALAAAYEKATGQKIVLEGGGSGAGAKAALAGQVDLAFLSRDLNESEKTGGLLGVPYAKDAVVVIAHPGNPATDLSIAQLKDIFTGRASTWPDGRALVAFNRNTDSGTREVFQEHVLGKEAFAPAIAVKHDGVILSTVEKIPSAIAFTSLGESASGKVKTLSVAGIAPSAATIRDGSYPLARTPTFATKGAAAGQAKAFIDFALSPQGQAVVAAAGLVPLR